MKTIKGKVVSVKMTKTVIVEVERHGIHPLYKKIFRAHKRYKAHNENTSIKIGDKVIIEETKPYSKDKHFKVKAEI